MGFVIAACLWWLYFDYVGSSALELSSCTSFYRGYEHLLIYAGIAAVGVGIQLVIEGAHYVAEMALAAGPRSARREASRRRRGWSWAAGRRSTWRR